MNKHAHSSSLGKWILIGAGGLVLLLAGAAITLKLMFPAAKIQRIALEKLQSALEREVRIADASIGIGGARLEGLEVSQRPDFAAGTLLTAQTLDIRLRLLPLLLRREVQIVRISLVDWKVSIAAGQAAGSPPQSGAAAASAGAPALAIAQLRIKGGEVEYQDKKAGTSVRLTDIAGEADDIRLDQAFAARLAFSYALGQGEEAATGTIDFAGTVDAGGGDPAKIKLRAQPLKADYAGLRLELAGELVGADKPALDCELSIPALPYAKLKKLAGGVPAGLDLPALKGRLRVRYADGLVDLKELELKGKGAALKLAARQSTKSWSIAPSRLQWQSFDLQFRGEVNPPPKKNGEMRLDLKLDSNRIALAELAAAAPKAVPEGLTGNAEFHVRVSGNASAPAVAGSAQFTGVGFAASGQQLSGLEGKVDFSPQTVKGELKGMMNNGALQLRLDARDYSGRRPSYQLDGSLSELDLGKLPSAPASAPAADGKSAPAAAADAQPIATGGSFEIGKIMHPKFQAGKTTVRWDLKELTPDLKRLGGTLKFDVGQGQFKDLKSLSDKPLVKIVLMPVIILQKVAHLVKVPLFPKFDQVDFKEITGDYSFAKGIMQVKESHLDSRIAYAGMTGSADLGKDRLDLRVSTRLPVKQIAGPIGFKVRGTLAQPEVKLDTAAILKQPAVEQALDQGKKLLEGLFRR
ncbi:MAG: AsmA-like C-terminal region-containing protein [Elusimicrobiota bacterium]